MFEAVDRSPRQGEGKDQHSKMPSDCHTYTVTCAQHTQRVRRKGFFKSRGAYRDSIKIQLCSYSLIQNPNDVPNIGFLLHEHCIHVPFPFLNDCTCCNFLIKFPKTVSRFLCASKLTANFVSQGCYLLWIGMRMSCLHY